MKCTNFQYILTIFSSTLPSSPSIQTQGKCLLPLPCKFHASVTSNAINVHELFKQVFDKDIGQDKRLGITKLPMKELEAETEKEFDLRLLPSLDMMKIKDKKDRGTLTIKVDIFNQRCLFCHLSEQVLLLV